MKNKYFFIGVTAILVGCFFLGAKFYKDSQQKKLNFLADEKSELFVREHSPRLGNPEAEVVLVEFLDPECESCRAFYPYVKNLMKEFEGKIQLVLRYAPFHGNSKEVIKALEASKKQGKYWQALDVLFATQPKWGSHHNPQVELIYEYLGNIGINVEELKKEMKDPQYEKVIDQDFSDLKALGVKGTPTFFVNGKKLQEFSYDALRALILSEIES